MQTIKLKLKSRSYNIIVGKKVLPYAGKYISRLNLGKDAYIITNSSIKRRYGNILAKGLKKHGFNFRFKVVLDSEKSKDIRVAASLIKDLSIFDLKRRPFIIALGGGVIGDLSGFVASIYKRGIPYVQIPTTLLAQVDSSIGGKTAVDLSEGKNLAGAFHQPSLVLSDISVLRTLNKRQVASGLAEVIKYGIIKDRDLFVYLEKNYKSILKLNSASLERIVISCAKIKASIVSYDEKEEKGLRTALNFGHTIGHAIEAAAGFRKYTHGESIALGMLIALDMCVKLKIINESLFKRVEFLIKNTGLPVKIGRIETEKILKKHYHDKKFKGSSNKFVMILGLGRIKIIKNIRLNLIRWAIERRR